MRLISTDRSVAQLDITGYEDPDGADYSDDEPPDGEWLMIRGEFAWAGRSWNFHAGALTIGEASELYEWLRDVAEGTLQPGTAPDDVGEHWLAFAEPDLAVKVLAHDDRTSTLRWLLNDESLVMDLIVDNTALSRSADEWRRQLDGFPTR